VITLSELSETISWSPRLRSTGRVCAVKGSLITARIPLVALGDLCEVERRTNGPLKAQVVSFHDDFSLLAPFGALEGICPGATVRTTATRPKVQLARDPRGLVLDALGTPLSSTPSDENNRFIELALDGKPPDPLTRNAITNQLITGVRAIDAFCPIGYGQRMGILAGAGVGKSTLLGTIARNASADVIVIALVGERGREVQDFLRTNLGGTGLARSVVVVATSDEVPLRRSLAPKTATTIAEHYRAQGANVLLLVDSLTRTARAIREVELAAGEIPVRQGYTAGVFTQLPQLLERAGTDSQGSITALYTILTNGDDLPDPLAEEAKSLLDGHITLDSKFAEEGIRPAINPLVSVSRLSEKLLSRSEAASVDALRCMLGRLRRDKDILLMGGTPDAELAAALHLESRLRDLLNQRADESICRKDCFERMGALAAEFLKLREETTLRMQKNLETSNT
jgi:FliI/YscN family ATPase